jgi:hypothetical protein
MRLVNSDQYLLLPWHGISMGPKCMPNNCVLIYLDQEQSMYGTAVGCRFTHREKSDGYVERCHGCVRAEKHEKLVVPETYAIVHPWTMMVHFKNATPAVLAVVCSAKIQNKVR